MNVITNTTVLPEQFETVEEAADFWNTHSLADCWDQVREVEIEYPWRASHSPKTPTSWRVH